MLERAENDEEARIVHIRPDTRGYGLLDYHKSDEIIKSGRLAARTALRDWKRRRSKLNLRSGMVVGPPSAASPISANGGIMMRRGGRGDDSDQGHIRNSSSGSRTSRTSSGSFGSEEQVGGTFQRRRNDSQSSRLTSTMSRARSIASLHLDSRRRVPSHLVLSPFPQNYEPQQQRRPDLQMSQQRSTAALVSPPSELKRNKLNDTSPKIEHLDSFQSLSMYSTERTTYTNVNGSGGSGGGGDGSGSGGSGGFVDTMIGAIGSDGLPRSNVSSNKDSDGLRVAHLHSQLTAAASRDRTARSSSGLARAGMMFNTLEYNSTDEDDDTWDGDGDQDNMRNAVMF